MLRMLLTMLVGIYVARYLGAEQYGHISYAYSFIVLFIALSTLGLDGILVRELVKKPDQRNELMGTGFIIKVVGTLIMWLAIMLAVSIVESIPETNTLVAIIAFSIIFQTFNVIDFNFQAEVKSKYVVHAQLAQIVLSSLIKMALVLCQAPLVAFAWVYCVDAIVLSGGLVFMHIRYVGKINEWRFRWHVAKSLLRDSWVLMFYAYFVTINMNIDIVMLKHIAGNESTGYYTVATVLSSAWYFLPVVIGSTFFPYIVKKKEEREYKSRVSMLFGFLTVLAVFGAVIVSSISYWIITLLYGNEFIESADILSIHIWTGVFVFHVSLRSRVLISDNLQRYSMLFMLVGVVINIICNILLIPQYGGVGAAYASLISWGTNVLFLPLLFEKTKNYTTLFFLSLNELIKSKGYLTNV